MLRVRAPVAHAWSMAEAKTQSKKYLQRALARRKLPPDDRNTLTTCLACDGEEPEIVELADGSYRKIPCRWCLGLGTLDKQMLVVFDRARRIYERNTAGGKCREKVKDGLKGS